MGTRISVRLWHEDADLGEAAVRAAIDEIARIERLMSTYMEDSRISAINREAHLGPVPAGGELYGLIERAVAVSAMTDGRFDITYDSVGQLYDFRDRRRPDQTRIEQGLPAIDYRFVELEPDDNSIAFARSGVRINLGGIAKGYAVERVIAGLREAGVQSALATAGGDTRLLGDRWGKPWLVGIRNPDDADGVVTRLALADEAISTSGDYERFFDEDGVRYHHILKPDTGNPARELRSVTVIGPDATLTDGLATSIFVLGAEPGLALIESLSGYEAVLIPRSGSLRFSSGLDPR